MGFGSVGVKEFIKLDDTPASYAGAQSKLVAVKVAEDALEFIAAPMFEGFGDDYTITLDPVDMLDYPFFRTDEIIFSIMGEDHKIIVESLEMFTWETWQSLSLYFCSRRGARPPTDMKAFFGMNRGNPDILANPTNSSIGVYLAGYQWHAQNGDGVNYTRTALDTYTPDYPMPFKIVRSDTDIKWYRNGVLKATHNTNIPIEQLGFKEHYSAQKLNDIRGDIACQHIKYFSGVFP